MIVPFSLIGKGTKTSAVIGFPTDGDLVILSGQTVTIASGSVKRYNDVIIRSGGVLKITGTAGGWTEIGVVGNLICDGTIICRSGYDGEVAHTGGTFTKASSAFGFGALTYTVAQKNGGAGGLGGGYATLLGLGGAQNLGRGGGGGGGGPSASSGIKAGNGGAGGSSGAGVTIVTSDKLGTHTTVISTGGTGTGLIDGSAGTTNGGNGAGGGGGGSRGTEPDGQLKSSGTITVNYGGGGGSGYRGHHGKGLTIYVEGVLSGSGLIACSGRAGFNGGSGGSTTAYDWSGGNIGASGGGGGGGAGGSGGKLLIKYKNIGRYISFSVAGGSGGLGGPAGAPYATINNSTAGSSGAAGDNGTLILTKIV